MALDRTGKFGVECVESAYFTGEYSVDPSKYSTQKWAESKIIDEDKSVRWNREQVEAHNKNVANEVKRKNSDYAEKRKQLHSDCIQGMLNDFDIDADGAERIYKFCEDKFGDDMVKFFDFLWDISNLVEDIK